jgi:hypothetical protein
MKVLETVVVGLLYLPFLVTPVALLLWHAFFSHTEAAPEEKAEAKSR